VEVEQQISEKLIYFSLQMLD